MKAPTPTSKIAASVSLIVVLAMLALAVYAPLSTVISGPVLLAAGISRVADRGSKVAEGVNLVLTAAGAALLGAAVLVTVLLVAW